MPVYFDPDTGTWYSVPDSGGGSNGGNNGGGNNNGGGSNSGNNNSRDRNKVKYKKVNINLLTGELGMNLSRKNLSVLPGMTVGLKGFGKYLSGGYFVTARTISFDDTSGMSLKIGVARPKFLDTIKGMSKYDD